jgi:hypothetical protein
VQIIGDYRADFIGLFHGLDEGEAFSKILVARTGLKMFATASKTINLTGTRLWSRIAGFQ